MANERGAVQSPAGPAERPADGGPDRPLLLGTITWLLERRRGLLVGAVAGLMALVGYRLFRGPEYYATSQFRPQGARRSPLAGLAQTFGFDLGAVGRMGEEESPFLYARLLAAGDLLRRAAWSTYQVPGDRGQADTVSRTLVDLYGIEASNRMALDRKVHDFMKKRVFVGVDVRAEVLTLRTEARWPAIAVQMNRRLLALLDEYNLVTRQSRAKAEREFVGQRLAEARNELETAEAELQRFFERNARYQESPELALEAARLERRVQLRQQVAATLAQSFEEARIDEVRDTPVINVVDPPEGSLREGSGLLRGAVIGLIIGILGAMGFLGVRDLLRHQRRWYPADYEAMANLARDALRVGGRAR